MQFKHLVFDNEGNGARRHLELAILCIERYREALEDTHDATPERVRDVRNNFNMMIVDLVNSLYIERDQRRPGFNHLVMWQGGSGRSNLKDCIETLDQHSEQSTAESIHMRNVMVVDLVQQLYIRRET